MVKHAGAVRLACHAMATRFELLLEGGDEATLRAAGEEALAVIQRLDAQLSRFRATSDIGRVNARAAAGPVRVAADTFALLRQARELHELTFGAFDITVGPLMHCWGFARGGRVPTAAEIDAARGLVGTHLLELDEQHCSVRFLRAGVSVDLGGIGKGYALEEAARTLREAGVTSALLHGGTSSVQALGDDDGAGWRVAIEYPQGPGEPAERVAAIVTLRDQALSVSAAWGRCFEADGERYGHVLDPRLGRPATGAVLGAVVCGSGTDAEAISTALLTLNAAERELLLQRRSDIGAAVLDSLTHPVLWTRGIVPLSIPRHDPTRAAAAALTRSGA